MGRLDGSDVGIWSGNLSFRVSPVGFVALVRVKFLEMFWFGRFSLDVSHRNVSK